ncbi:MAG TPA: protein-disulfide reductase DsbD N-terminal domain-containing protein, partial [Thermoanaerobaculia bacterium]|nr:protein-disulfide reductase DsbD N-terminal domain-containing protein [Thermoanaerobaculia bacterium]
MPTRRLRRTLVAPSRTLHLVTLLALVAGPAAAALQAPEKASLALQADRTSYTPGDAGRLTALVHIESGWHVNSHHPTYEYLIPTELQVELPAGWPAPELTYPEPEIARFTFADEPLSVYQGEVPIVAAFRVPPAAASGEVTVAVTLTYQACNDTQCLPPVQHTETLALRVSSGGAANAGAPPARAQQAPPGTATAPPPAAEHPPPPLLWMLGLALLGGLILNAMPCVLPVLSIK